ncbi:site-specific recombinase XerD [Variovorax sp. 54]|uniref:site-specific integrase n=1 Tax=Variovorax sp. 54 TaxID=2035212 RepID=UPI000C4DB6BD|nr:tyrosine-type recombinase/integrase [Variovorax sp. 54]PIF77513.1 site-specific recombinase XerD [Variovorax sp. 54]
MADKVSLSRSPVASAARNTPRPAPPTRFEATSATVDGFTAAAQSEATRRAYAGDLKHFRKHGGKIPATPQMVANYVAQFAGVHAVATLNRRLIALHQAHTEQGLTSPVMDRLVKRTMQGIRRTFGVAQRRVKALVKTDLLEMLVMVNRQKPMKAARDRALLLIGFAGALRRSELVAIQCADVTRFEGGAEIHLPRSKTDQVGAGRTVWVPHAKDAERCPVAALDQWLALSGVSQGPVFRWVSRHDNLVGDKGLTSQSVALVVKRSVKRVHGAAATKAVSGHSLRAGYCTEAALVGMAPWQIREQTGHKSDVTLAKYIRPITKRKIPSLL